MEPSWSISKHWKLELHIQSLNHRSFIFPPTSQICWKWFRSQIWVFPILNTDWQQEERVQGSRRWGRSLKELHYLVRPGSFISLSISLRGKNRHIFRANIKARASFPSKKMSLSQLRAKVDIPIHLLPVKHFCFSSSLPCCSIWNVCVVRWGPKN